MIDCKELLYHFGGSVSSDILGSEYNILFVRFLFMSSLMRHKMGRGEGHVRVSGNIKMAPFRKQITL